MRTGDTITNNNSNGKDNFDIGCNYEETINGDIDAIPFKDARTNWFPKWVVLYTMISIYEWTLFLYTHCPLWQIKRKPKSAILHNYSTSNETPR